MIKHEHHIEFYRAFEIIHYRKYFFGTDHFKVKKDGNMFSVMCLASILACRNVIDTWHRSLNHQATKLYLQHNFSFTN